MSIAKNIRCSKRTFFLMVLLFVASPIFPADIICFDSAGKKIYEKSLEKFYIEPHRDFIAIEGNQGVDLIHGDCRIKYTENEKGRRSPPV